MRRLVAILGLLLAAGATAQPAAPVAFQARYALVSSGVRIGVTEWRLIRTPDGGYRYQAHSEPRGLFAILRKDVIDERSEGSIGADGRPRPERYRYLRAGGKKRREVSIRFDWGAGIAHTATPANEWTQAVPAGTLDKLVYMLALMRDLAGGVKELAYDIADGGKLKRYVFRTVGRESLETGIGRLETVRLRREHRSARETTVWSAPALGYLPVRVDHRDKDGTVVSLRLETLERLDTPSSAAAPARPSGPDSDG